MLVLLTFSLAEVVRFRTPEIYGINGVTAWSLVGNERRFPEDRGGWEPWHLV